jgi:hypothetical protein
MTEHETWTAPPGFKISDGSGGAQKPVVAVGTPTVGDTLVYDGTKFVPQASSGGETVVYGSSDPQPDGAASSWGPMTLPADKTVLELRISGGGAAAGQAFGLVLNGDTDPSHYGGAGVPGNPSFFTTADSLNTTASFQIICTIAHYRRVGRHVLPFLVAYDDRAADAVAFDTDRGSFRQVAALTSLTILSFNGAGVAAPFPVGTLIEVVAW